MGRLYEIDELADGIWAVCDPDGSVLLVTGSWEIADKLSTCLAKAWHDGFKEGLDA
jgi:hypothetical protein